MQILTLVGKEVMMSPWNIRFNANSYTSRQRGNDVTWNIRLNANSYTSRQRGNDVTWNIRLNANSYLRKVFDKELCM